MLGKVYLAEGSPEQWRIDYFEADRIAQDYFIPAHRGHVMGLVDSASMDRAIPDSDAIEATFELQQIRKRHPDLNFDLESDALAPATEHLARLLRPRT